MAETAKWYVVHTYSGYENTVKATIEKTVESRQLQDQILAISIPLETVTEITDSGVSEEIRQLVEDTVLSIVPFETVIHSQAGCTVSCHCGPGTFGIVMVRK